MIFSLQSPLKATSISTLVTATLLAGPLALSARPSAGRRIAVLKPTTENSSRQSQPITVPRSNTWTQDVKEIGKAVEVGGIGTRKGRLAKARAEFRFGPPGQVSIYLYNSHGNAINVTGVDSYQEPIVIDAVGDLIGTVESDDNIYNSFGVIVGLHHRGVVVNDITATANKGASDRFRHDLHG